MTAAALELFSTEGYARTPIERICEVSHVTTRHFYELFPSKERLLAAVLEEVMDHARSAVTRALASPVLDPVERGRAGISAFVHSYLDDPRHARIVLVEVVGVSPQLEKRRRELIREFADIIKAEARRLADQGTISERDFSPFSMAMAGAINELLVDWINTENPSPIEEIINELVRLLRIIVQGTIAVEREKTFVMTAYDLGGRYALVTGTSSGMGKEPARLLAMEGTNLVMAALPGDAEELEAWARELSERHGVETHAAAVDLASPEGPTELVERALKSEPHLDILVNCAGIYAYGDFHEVPLQHQLLLIDVNVKALTALTHLVLPGMIARKQGRILNFSSTAAFQPTANEAVNAAGKAYVQSFSEAVRQEVRKYGSRCAP